MVTTLCLSITSVKKWLVRFKFYFESFKQLGGAHNKPASEEREEK